ncbi:DUF2917 domain-containing protein [Geomonas sp. Red69]|uniref:DUF2917 domain-containing protein n=1 Tax=Geomonas diazotrophica TaxID=2843197 RepID=A0ABX8JGW1_9BACT|nr:MULTISPECIES: DUF2917 domain-containing protein [Geomonas]MBU5638170.1 DUF2917 domain-containing protein [Geomonas diazotrophica]QWV95889.1 DUF2917 domain-containing protein [Geomonas nitrogeniifigens]QXE84975.1 DUF2917 domain-containing protein [Geomonas nitrogeniifigens]
MRYLLAKGEVVTIKADDAVESLVLVAGEVWLTRSSDTRDYCLKEGRRLTVARGETLIIEALAPCTLAITCRELRAGLRITMAWHRTSPRTA